MKRIKNALKQSPKVFGVICSMLKLAGSAEENLEKIFSYAKPQNFSKIEKALEKAYMTIGVIKKPCPAGFAGGKFAYSGYVCWRGGIAFSDASLNPNDAMIAAAVMAIKTLDSILPNQKNASKNDVADVAQGLLNAQGTATTLEVKDILRGQGFYIVQADVSKWMEELCESEGWDFDITDGHREYSLPQDSVDDDFEIEDEDDDEINVADYDDDESDSGIHRVGNWACRAAGKTKETNFRNISWYEAKRTFARQNGLNYYDVRIRKA